MSQPSEIQAEDGSIWGVAQSVPQGNQIGMCVLNILLEILILYKGHSVTEEPHYKPLPEKTFV